MSAVDTFVLSVLAGAFIAVGAIFATTVTAGGSALPYGVSRLLGGLAFSLGLILVVVAGAELFTGNNLIVMAWASRKVSTARLLRNWTLVYAGNFAGAIATAGIRLRQQAIHVRQWRSRRAGARDRHVEDAPGIRSGNRARGRSAMHLFALRCGSPTARARPPTRSWQSFPRSRPSSRPASSTASRTCTSFRSGSS